MRNSREPKHFIVQHDLDSLTALPQFIWRTGKGPNEVPHRFDQVSPGDRWIAFAFTSTDNREKRLSLVTGFFVCTSPKYFGDIPSRALHVSDGERKAWIIEGKSYGQQPERPVGVPPLADLLKRQVWGNQAIVPITSADFESIRAKVMSDRFDARKISLLGREPENEQELLAVVVHSHKSLGIEKIIRVRKAFPDLLVKIKGHHDEFHLELEVYSKGFFSHGHDKHVRDLCFDGDKKHVAILCWIDNDKHRKVRNCVHKVYELRSLISNGKKISW